MIASVVLQSLGNVLEPGRYGRHSMVLTLFSHRMTRYCSVHAVNPESTRAWVTERDLRFPGGLFLCVFVLFSRSPSQRVGFRDSLLGCGG